MDYSLVVFMMHKEEGGGSPQTEVDIQRRLIVHVTMHVIAPTIFLSRKASLNHHVVSRDKCHVWRVYLQHSKLHL
jgi:hypothetical protein